MNLNQLWDKCAYCPRCRDASRVITVSLFPNRVLKDLTFLKSEEALILSSYITIRSLQLHVRHIIDCEKNEFEIAIEEETEREMDADKSTEEKEICQRVDRSDAEFWLDGNCPKCRSHICSNNIPLKMRSKKLKHVGIETETIYLKPYEIVFYPDQDRMEVSKNEKEVLTTSKPITLPLVELDFTDPQEALERLETLLVFS